MIDRGDIRQAIDRCSNIWASLPGAGYGQFEHKADSLIAKFKEAGGTVREIDVWAICGISALVICIIVHCHGLLIITVITPLPTRLTREQMPEGSEAGERGNYWHADASAWCCCARCKIHEGVSAVPKLKMMLCVMMLPLVVVGYTSKQSVSQCVKPPPPPAWIMQPPPDWRAAAERDYFTLRERLITMPKTTGRNPEVY